MSKTSTEVKRRYNDKTYKRWFADIRIEEFERIEAMRGDMSRSAFLNMLLDAYNGKSEEEKAVE